jgi:phage-related protein
MVGITQKLKKKCGVIIGLQKKTPKTPKGELERAIRLMNEYYKEKKGIIE